MTTIYSSDEVSRHDTENSLWMVMHGGVYDLTKFLAEHPGGEEVLLQLAGKDGSVCFDEIGHSEEAIQLRQRFKIGEFVAGSQPVQESDTSTKEPTVDDDNWEYQEFKEEKSPWLVYTVAAAVLIYGVIFYYMFYS